MTDFSGGQIRDLMAHFGIADDPVAVLSIAGIDGVNNIGVYDDRFYHSINGDVKSYTGNVDPSKQRTRMATLARMQVFHWKPGIHGLSKPAGPRRYPAFVQAEAVIVNRFNVGADKGLFGINHHKGGVNGTSSLGCQTYHPNDWAEARERLYAALGTSVEAVARRESTNRAFPYVVVPVDSAIAILRQGRVAEEPVVPPTPIAPAWTIRLKNEQGHDEVYSEAVNIAGRVFVPIRDFCTVALGCTPEDAPLEWRDGPGGDDDEQDLVVNGKGVDEVCEIGEHAFVWIVEVAEALGFDIQPNPSAKTLTLVRR